MKNELIKNDWRFIEIENVESEYLNEQSNVSVTKNPKPKLMVFGNHWSTGDIARSSDIRIGSCYSKTRLN